MFFYRRLQAGTGIGNAKASQRQTAFVMGWEADVEEISEDMIFSQEYQTFFAQFKYKISTSRYLHPPLRKTSVENVPCVITNNSSHLKYPEASQRYHDQHISH